MGVTVTKHVAVDWPALAVMVAVPVMQPFTRPSWLTVATAGWLLLQVTLGVFSSSGVTVACSCTVENIGIVTDDSSSEIEYSCSIGRME